MFNTYFRPCIPVCFSSSCCFTRVSAICSFLESTCPTFVKRDIPFLRFPFVVFALYKVSNLLSSWLACLFCTLEYVFSPCPSLLSYFQYFIFPSMYPGVFLFFALLHPCISHLLHFRKYVSNFRQAQSSFSPISVRCFCVV